MDRSLVQAKQSRSCTGVLERIASAKADTAGRHASGLDRKLCGLPAPERMRHLARRAPDWCDDADSTAVPMGLACVRDHRAAPGIARGWQHAVPPAGCASTSNDISRSFNR